MRVWDETYPRAGGVSLLRDTRGVIFADRVEPFVFGMPLLFFWIVAWAVLTSATMAVVYLLDPANKVDETE